MRLIKQHSVFDALPVFHEMLETMKQSIWNSPTFLFERNWRPFQFKEDDKNVVITVELPGFKRDEIVLQVLEDGVLRAGVLRLTANSPTRGAYTHEFASAKTDFNNAEVKLEDGILTITSAIKQEVASKPKQLKIS